MSVGQQQFSMGGIIGTILWGFFVAIGARIGWGIVGFLIDVIAKAVHNS